MSGWNVSWKRAVLAFAATMLSVYALGFALNASGNTPSIVWMFYFVLLSCAVMWGVMLYPSKNAPPMSSQ